MSRSLRTARSAVMPPAWSPTRLMGALLAAQVLGSTGHSIGMAVGGIMAAEITGTNAWVGLPVALGALGAALASWPISRVMGWAGRRPGLVIGYGLAVVGAVLGMVGVLTRSFALLLFGMALFGMANTSNLLARYAAADVTPGPRRGRAMGLIVWGSAVGSILGPNLMGPVVAVGRPLGLSPVGSAFLISIASYGLAAIVIAVLLRPDPLRIAPFIPDAAAASHRGRAARPFAEILGDPRVRMALIALMASQLVMIGTTSTSPVYLHDQGHHVRTIGLAVAFHLGGMYIASPVSGWLCDRFGRLPMIGLGGLVLVAALTLAGLVPGSESGLVMAGLFLNGIGWNLCFVAGSALLTDALTATERTSIQGMADLAMGMMGALGSALGGLVLGLWGFLTLNALGAVLVVGPLIVAWHLRPAPIPVPAERREARSSLS